MPPPSLLFPLRVPYRTNECAVASRFKNSRGDGGRGDLLVQQQREHEDPELLLGPRRALARPDPRTNRTRRALARPDARRVALLVREEAGARGVEGIERGAEPAREELERERARDAGDALRGEGRSVSD